MARKDTQSSRLSRGGGGRYRHYDDQGRGDSKWLWEEFESHFEASGYSEKWLMGKEVKGVDPTLHKLFTDTELNRFFSRDRKSLLEHGLYDGRLYCYTQNMRDRFNVHDFAWDTFTDSPDNDGRMRRLIVKKLGLKIWKRFQVRAYDVYLNINEQRKEEQAEQAKNEQAQSAFRAETIKSEVREIRKETDLIAGAIRSEFDQAFSMVETYGQEEGDWLDDPVEGFRTGYGFGEEVKSASGIKLQVTVSLDLSNSMHHNNVSRAASDSFRDIYLALEQLKQEHPADLFISAFTFCHNGRGATKKGRVARNLGVTWERNEETGKLEQVQLMSGDDNLGAVKYFKEANQWNHFTGEDTWFYPLFEEIEKWENMHSESGAVKLDIIITDAVIEHPSDVRKSDVIQERRDGALQTVMLNFLPDTDWVDSSLPSRCVQYAANAENIAGLLRNILTEFVSVNL